MTPTDYGPLTAQISQRSESDPGPFRRARRRRLIRKIGLVMSGLVLITVGLGVLLAHQVSSVRTQLEQAVNLVPQLRADLEEGDHQTALATFNSIKAQTSAAHSTTTGLLWKVASFIPVYGANFSAAREVAVSADDITVRAVAPLLDRYDSLKWDDVLPKNGRIEFVELQKSAPDITTAAVTVRMSHERMASIDLSRLRPELARPIGVVTEQLEELSEVLDTASSAAQLMPAMLGAQGSRNFLVLVQNNSEARATGGISGALAVLQTDDGHISLGEQTSAAALGAFRPMLDVDPEQVNIYTARLGTQMQNVNLTPDFPTAAKTAKDMWEKRHPSQTVDGVLALDPVVLSHLLMITGPLDLVDSEVLNQIQNTNLPSSLTSDNVVPTLLSDVYRDIEDPIAQDAYFAAVASRVFSAFTEGQGDGAQLVKALGKSVKENRLYMWSSDATEQSIIASTPLAGSVTGPETGGAAFGVYVNDGTGAKMDFYVTRTVELIQACPLDGYGQYTVRVQATNNAPADAATSLPSYVTGGGYFGVEPGRIRTNYVVYGPAQAFVETAAINGNPVPVNSGMHRQRPVGTVQLEIGPGETATIELLFSGVVQSSEPHLRVTPSVQAPEDVVLPFIRATCG